MIKRANGRWFICDEQGKRDPNVQDFTTLDEAKRIEEAYLAAKPVQTLNRSSGVAKVADSLKGKSMDLGKRRKG